MTHVILIAQIIVHRSLDVGIVFVRSCTCKQFVVLTVDTTTEMVSCLHAKSLGGHPDWFSSKAWKKGNRIFIKNNLFSYHSKNVGNMKKKSTGVWLQFSNHTF